MSDPFQWHRQHTNPFQWHRQFTSYTPPNFKHPPAIVSIRTPGFHPAFTWSGDAFASTRISPKGGQYFPQGCTTFEADYSVLCENDPSFSFIPVVDADYWVIGHIGGVTDGNGIFVPKGRALGAMNEILEAGHRVFISTSNPDSSQFEAHDEHMEGVYTFLTDPYGEVKQFISLHSKGGLESPAIDPSDLINIGRLVVAIGKGVGRYLARKAVDRLTAATFRIAMTRVEKRLLARGARDEVAKIKTLTEEELSTVRAGRTTSVLAKDLSTVRGGGTTKPLTKNQLDRAVELLRNGHEVHVESIGQMRQIQGELGQLGVRSESSSAIIPQRPAASIVGRNQEVVPEIPGSWQDGRGTYRVDPPHGSGETEYTLHNEYIHINITLRNGGSRTVVVTGTKNF
jgi:hypothetical protein